MGKKNLMALDPLAVGKIHSIKLFIFPFPRDASFDKDLHLICHVLFAFRRPPYSRTGGATMTCFSVSTYSTTRKTSWGEGKVLFVPRTLDPPVMPLVAGFDPQWTLILGKALSETPIP